MNGKLTDPFVTAIFCDDIRHEKGEKLSLMGIYQSELLLQSIPAVLPKLCALVTLLLPLDLQPKTLQIVMIHGDTPIAGIDIPVESIPVSPIQDGDVVTRRSFISALTISPLVIEKPGSLRVNAILNGNTVIGPRLKIDLVGQDSSLQKSSTRKKKLVSLKEARGKSLPKKT